MLDHCLAGLRTIRDIRRAKASELASLIGVTANSYSRFERGERRIHLDKAAMLARRLGVKIDDLMHPLTEDDAARLCDERDKAAIAAGLATGHMWNPVTGSKIVFDAVEAPQAPATVPPPPPPALTVPPPPSDPDALPQELQDWINE